MQSIIEEIYFGNRGQSENIKFGEDYKKSAAESLEIFNKMYPTFTDGQKKLFDALQRSDGEQSAISECANFVEGFKVGFLIAVECFTK